MLSSEVFKYILYKKLNVKFFIFWANKNTITAGFNETIVNLFYESITVGRGVVYYN